MNYFNYIKLAMLIFILFPLLPGQSDYEKWLKEQQREMSQIIEDENNYMASVTKQFDQYKNEQERLYKQFKEEVEKKWDSFRFSSPTEYVDYDNDLSARAAIDFENGVVEIEVLIEDVDAGLKDNQDGAPLIDKKDQKYEGKQSQKSKLVIEDQKNLTSNKAQRTTMDTKNQKVVEDKQYKEAQVKLQKKLKQISTKRARDNKPILKDQLQTKSGKKVTNKNVSNFVKIAIQSQKLDLTKILSKDGKKRVKYTAKVYMPPDHLDKRAERFRAEVIKQSERFEIDPAIAFAIMHTESSFNPNARSHIPAFGLMQLVPSSGARDAYNYVYKKDKLLEGKYLYNPANNIELGCAYIRKIRYEYFKGIKDEEAAYFCTISAYNTGIGNVARTFTGSTKLKPAVAKINQRNADQVYQFLLKNLPYDETKNYLVKVTDRIDLYQK